MKVFISGASGLVGGNCISYFKSKGIETVGSHFSFETEQTVPFNTLDLNNPSNYDVIGFNPDYILHCGALTWVDYCEQHEEESYEKTVQSTKNLIDIAKQCNSKLVFIGTDYIFDGADGPYTEDVEPNPVNIYGRHKLEAEQLVAQELPESLILRITNVYGKELRNKNFVMRLVDNVKAGKDDNLKLPFDQYATPVNAADIAKALYLLMSDKKSGVYNIASTDYLNRVQLAERVLSYFPNHKMSVEPVDTETFNPPAKRPLNGGLISAKFLSEYPHFIFTNVDDFMKEILS